jgi:hypothetical protein
MCRVLASTVISARRLRLSASSPSWPAIVTLRRRWDNANLYLSTISRPSIKSIVPVLRAVISNFNLDSGICTEQINCSNGGYPNPNDCMRCLCPTGLADPLCETPIASPKCPSPDVIADYQWRVLSWQGSEQCVWMIRVHRTTVCSCLDRGHSRAHRVSRNGVAHAHFEEQRLQRRIPRSKVFG